MTKLAAHKIKTNMPLWVAAWFVFFLDGIANSLAYNSCLRVEVGTLLPVLSEELLLVMGIQVFWGLVFFFSGLYPGEPTTSRCGDMTERDTRPTR